jgi:hypothetical protein
MRITALTLPPLKDLKHYLTLDSEQGKLFWIERKCVKYPLGAEAGTCTNGKKGYLTLGWDGKRYLAHRIIYYMHTGTDPGDMCVDHINGDVKDNRPVNLRLATPRQNSQNMTRPMRNNKTGVLGVHWNSQNKTWCAKISVKRRAICQFFPNFDDAVAEIAKLRAEHYGEFAGGVKKCV